MPDSISLTCLKLMICWAKSIVENLRHQLSKLHGEGGQYSDLRIRSAKQSRLVLALSCSSLAYLLDFLEEPVMAQFSDRDQQESREPSARTNVILTELSFPPHCTYIMSARNKKVSIN